ncbi:MAG: YdcF family protein [Phycisphaerae bacterium]|nr:YdcF family protein [Phycisphaerae bacterium]
MRNALAIFALVLLLVVITPLGDLWISHFNIAMKNPPSADAIICLGGGTEREVWAAVLWHRQIAPTVIVSNYPRMAEAMAARIEEAGVPAGDVRIDNTSYTTWDHPRGVARLPGIDPEHQHFVLVTDGMHSRRARDCFLKAGYQHISVWSGYDRIGRSGYIDRCFGRLRLTPELLYETAAEVKYRWQGKL